MVVGCDLCQLSTELLYFAVIFLVLAEIHLALLLFFRYTNVFIDSVQIDGEVFLVEPLDKCI